MSASTVLTLGFGSFGSVNFLPTLGYGTAGKATTTKDTHDGKYFEDIYEESVEEKYGRFKEARRRLRDQIESGFFERYESEKAEAREVVARIERDIPKLDWERIESRLYEFAKARQQEEEFIVMELLN